MLLSSGTLADAAIVGAGGAAGAVAGVVINNAVPALPTNLLLPVAIGLGVGASRSLYDLIASDRSVSLQVEGRTAIMGGALAFALGPLGLGGSLPVVGQYVSGSGIAAMATLGFLTGSVTGLLNASMS